MIIQRHSISGWLDHSPLHGLVPPSKKCGWHLPQTHEALLSAQAISPTTITQHMHAIDLEVRNYRHYTSTWRIPSEYPQ